MNFKKKNKLHAWVRTFLINLVIYLILFFGYFRTPIPPYPDGGGGMSMGVEINLGFSAEGMTVQQENSEIVLPDINKLQEQATTSTDQEKLATQDLEQEESLPQPIEAQKPFTKKIIRVQPVIKEQPVVKQPPIEKEQKPTPVQDETPKKPVINTKALFPSKTNPVSQGNGKTPGVAGNPDGSPGSRIYAGTGTGTGSGEGTGGGAGSGKGTGVGDGISFNLDGRYPSFLPKPDYNIQSEGKVVVEITVDNQGKVTQAVAGVKGSTTLDEYLLDVAKQAALKSRFNTKLDAPAYQKGYITYRFMLQ